MYITHRKHGSSITLSKIMDNVVKDITAVIGYEKTMLLKDWKKAFPKEYVHLLSFEKMKQNKDGSTVLYLKSINPSVSLLIHYEKLIIIEKLAKIVGSKIITDFKISAK